MNFRLNDYDPKDVMRFIREATDLDRKEFGKMIGRSPKTIKSYENGERNYTVRLLKDIAKKFNIEIIIHSKEK